MMTRCLLLASTLGLAQALTFSTIANTAVDAGAALALAAGPAFVPQLKQGYDAMAAKYENVPDGEFLDSTGWRGIFPEYDGTATPLSKSHVQATIIVSFFLFFGALEQARVVVDGDYNDVFAMILYAFSYQGDSFTHAVIAYNEGADGNVMQKGHKFDTIPMIAFFLYANYLDGGSWYALTDLPAEGYWMFLPRIVSSPLFLLLTFYAWQPAHGAGLWLPKKEPGTV
mmetsp:Transcript_17385/g.54293  ORF Transcript_17385/g.54293 Transcript_17385/m.54293 type:complete len:227 (-) Transcript_17385:178-858(-)